MSQKDQCLFFILKSYLELFIKIYYKNSIVKLC